jgi:hypothetical protein
MCIRGEKGGRKKHTIWSYLVHPQKEVNYLVLGAYRERAGSVQGLSWERKGSGLGAFNARLTRHAFVAPHFAFGFLL